MPSLAGRPPYATNEPDSAYAVPAARPRPPQQQQQQNRTSAYNVYDNYLDANGQAPNRTSGVGAAFLNGDMDDSDSEDEQEVTTRRPMDPHHTPVSIPVPEPISAISGKHAALAAAVHRTDSDPNPPPQYRAQPPTAPAPAAIAAPRPGYAAPIAALNNQSDNSRSVPPGIHVPSPHRQIGSGTPSPTTPHPLEAPLTPIQPAFARPRPPKATDVKFTGDIMRGDKEESMLPKRGERGDDFWRRFSMVVKDEGTKKEKTSAWLRKTNNGNSSYATWVWIVGIILIIAAAGGIGLGFYVSNKAPDHYQPTAIGGSANESGVTTTLKSVGSAGATAKSSLQLVTPTNTVARRADLPLVTPEVVKITPDIPDWMLSKREDYELPEVVKIEPEVPDWMQTSNKRKRHAHNRVH